MIKKKKHTGLKVFIIVLIIILCFAGGGVGYFYYKAGKVKKKTISKKPSDLGIKDESKFDQYKGITNIAFFGLDRRHVSDISRSDSIMVVTLDGIHNKIKFSSIMRDTYVSVDGHGMTKITHAYAYGGPQLAVKTINENFGLNIKDYVTVDFFAMEKIIDQIGGVNINVTSDELKYINSYIDEVSKLENVTPNHVTKAGEQLLDGRQAVAYCRIRYTAGGDYERTERQRTVLMALINKEKEKGASGMLSMVNSLLPYAETSMSSTDIMKYSTAVVSKGMFNNLEEERFPVDGYCKGMMLDGVWYLWADLKAATDQMQKFIFQDIKPVSKAPLS